MGWTRTPTCRCDFDTLMRGGCQCGFEKAPPDPFLGTWENTDPLALVTLTITPTTFVLNNRALYGEIVSYNLKYTDKTYDISGHYTFQGIYMIEGDILTVSYRHLHLDAREVRPKMIGEPGAITEKYKRVK